MNLPDRVTILRVYARLMAQDMKQQRCMVIDLRCVSQLHAA